MQVIARTDPSYLAIANELYAEQMAIEEDKRAIAVATAAVPVGAPNNIALSLAAPAGWIPGLATGAATIYGGHAVPDAFVVGLDIWKAFASAVDATGRPLFTSTSASNPAGSSSLSSTDGNVRGLTFVLDPNMAVNIGIMGWSRAFTTMLGGVQTMRADNPTETRRRLRGVRVLRVRGAPPVGARQGDPRARERPPATARSTSSPGTCRSRVPGRPRLDAALQLSRSTTPATTRLGRASTRSLLDAAGDADRPTPTRARSPGRCSCAPPRSTGAGTASTGSTATTTSVPSRSGRRIPDIERLVDPFRAWSWA